MIEYTLWSTAITYLLYVFYSAVMNIKRVRDMGKLTTFGKVLGYPTLAIGLFLDLLVNTLVMTFILLELPRELTVTSRLKRHNLESIGGSWLNKWRMSVVKFFEPVLDPLDPSGDHI
jgi:hypothetical protein